MCKATDNLLTGWVGRWTGSDLPVSLTAYSVVGAAAYMGGATRMTLTTTVMVMETTGALQLIVPIMLTVFVSKVKSRTLHPLAPARVPPARFCLSMPTTWPLHHSSLGFFWQPSRSVRVIRMGMSNA